jgi:hypothetical protein
MDMDPEQNPGTFRVWPSRRIVDPFDMKPDDIELVDIANALARQCRYNGHVDGFISVAEHCIQTARFLQAWGHPTDIVATGLMHDAAETYLGDILGPLKKLPAFAAYRVAEDAVEKVIAAKYGLPFPFPPEIKQADRASLRTEMVEPKTRNRPLAESPSIEQVVADFLAFAAELGLHDASLPMAAA